LISLSFSKAPGGFEITAQLKNVRPEVIVSSIMVSSTATASNTTVPTQFVTSGDDKYAYRRFGSGAGLLLLFLQHFTGTLDNWDPAVTDALAQSRSVVLFESAGIGRSSGRVPATVAGTADHAIKFLDALGMTLVDALGFSLGDGGPSDRVKAPGAFSKDHFDRHGPRGWRWCGHG
jgi:hypothetical protein